jgi:hypothetical protein
MRIFRDGVQVASLDGTGASAPIDTVSNPLVGPIRFGASKVSPSVSHYHGTIDEIRVYNYAVSNANIASIYQSQAASFVGLIGRWKFNENSGSTAQDDTAFDHDGAITGAAWIGGNEGSALDFEGTDYVTVPSSALAALDKETTVTMWLYGDPAFQPQANSVIAATDSGGRSVINAVVPHSTSIVYWYCGASPYGTDDYMQKAATPSEYEGQWNHWAFTKNAVTGSMKIYLNGNPTPWHSETGKYRSITQATSFKIGSAANGTGNYDGMIDDVRVYNTELNGADIQSIYQGN